MHKIKQSISGIFNIIISSLLNISFPEHLGGGGGDAHTLETNGIYNVIV